LALLLESFLTAARQELDRPCGRVYFIELLVKLKIAAGEAEENHWPVRLEWMLKYADKVWKDFLGAERKRSNN